MLFINFEIILYLFKQLYSAATFQFKLFTFSHKMFPLPNSAQRASGGQNGRNKVALGKGKSLMHWIQVMNSGRDLRGVGPGLLRVTTEELAKHDKMNDCWMAIRGSNLFIFISHSIKMRFSLKLRLVLVFLSH